MILYLDTSALIKRYIQEPESPQVAEWIDDADAFCVSLIGRAEIAAALGRLKRMGALDEATANDTLNAFRDRWPTYVRLPVDEMTVARADELAWQHGLRGYDAVHLASAVLWREYLGEMVTLVTYDRQLWAAAQAQGLAVLPDAL